MKGNFVKENKKPFNFIKIATKHKSLPQIYIAERLKKVAHAVSHSNCLGYGPKSVNLQSYDAQAKLNVFLPIDTAIK